MIIESLLDTDLYKFTMMQAVLHRFPAAEVLPYAVAQVIGELHRSPVRPSSEAWAHSAAVHTRPPSHGGPPTLRSRP